LSSCDAESVEAGLRFARQQIACREDAEDVAHEALLKLLVCGEKVTAPIPWLWVVIRHLAKRRAHTPRPAPLFVDQRVDPWAEVELEIDTRQLLATLPERSRQCLCLFNEGFTATEIAARLGCSVKTAEKSIFKARRRLRGVYRKS